ncbi:hypothetical protein QE152_g4400 [Popillia japonica]|uniref:Uncharacterized protein n=1 Tax=Popillia japonica TaxID=7064 RepID=A0AAW1MYG6_POPJA
MWREEELQTISAISLQRKTSPRGRANSLPGVNFQTISAISLQRKTSPRGRANSLPGVNFSSTQGSIFDSKQERNKTAKRLREQEAEDPTQYLRKEVERLLKPVRVLSADDRKEAE